MLRIQEERLVFEPLGFMERVKAELTIKNPDHQKKKAMGLNRWAWGPEYIKLWNERTINGRKEYILPRGYLHRLREIVGDIDANHRDGRLFFPALDFPCRPDLRDYQLPTTAAAHDAGQGVLIAPCGSGKTICGLAIIASCRQPAIWITHTMDLLKQSMDRAIEHLGLAGDQIGIIQGKNMEIGSHITFATVQTLAKRDLTEIRNKFGLVMVDEAHLCFKDAAKARMFESVISQFPAWCRFGLTASEYRSDGLIETMFHILGPKFYEVKQDDPRLMVMTPQVEFIETDFKYTVPEDETLNIQQIYKAMREDEKRNIKIEQVLVYKVSPEDCCLVLGDSLEHLQLMAKNISDCNRTAAFVCGDTPKKEREKIMTDMRDGKYQFLFATKQLAKLGLDIPRLNKLVIMTPHRDKTTAQQAVGRIMRPHPGKKQPVVYDIYDSQVPQLVYWARERTRVYKRLGCQVTGGPTVRKW